MMNDSTSTAGTGLVKVSPSTLTTALIALVRRSVERTMAGRPGLAALVLGGPGTGKSSIFRAVADTLSMVHMDFRTTLWDSVDLRGIPEAEERPDGTRGTAWRTPSVFPTEQDPPTLLCLEEINAAPQATQVACYQLVLERRIGDYLLPPTAAVLACGNRLTDQAAAQRMSSALGNRFVQFELAESAADWLAWAASADIHPAVRAEAASEILWTGLDGEAGHAAVAGCVGRAVAVEFEATRRLVAGLDLQAIFRNPQTAPIPDAPASRFAVAYALATFTTAATLRSALTYLDRLPAEYAALSVRSAIKRNPALKQEPAYNAWCIAHASETLDAEF